MRIRVQTCWSKAMNSRVSHAKGLLLLVWLRLIRLRLIRLLLVWLLLVHLRLIRLRVVWLRLVCLLWVWLRLIRLRVVYLRRVRLRLIWLLLVHLRRVRLRLILLLLVYLRLIRLRVVCVRLVCLLLVLLRRRSPRWSLQRSRRLLLVLLSPARHLLEPATLPARVRHFLECGVNGARRRLALLWHLLRDVRSCVSSPPMSIIVTQHFASTFCSFRASDDLLIHLATKVGGGPGVRRCLLAWVAVDAAGRVTVMLA
jgi:hypothetical protein